MRSQGESDGSHMAGSSLRPSDPVSPEGVGGEEAGTRVTQTAGREATLTPLLGPGPLIPGSLAILEP